MDPETESLAQGGSKHEQVGEGELTAKQVTSDTSDLEDRLANETHLRRFTEDVLDSRQQEIEDRETEKDQLAASVEALKRKLANTQRQLAEAQDQIFRLQPRRKDITEAEAREAYKNLVGNVQRWVENRARYVIDDLETGRLNARAVPPEGSRFVTLLREQSRRCLSVDQSDEFHIIAVIMSYLHITLFSKSFYCPLTDTEEDGTPMWIDELENTMYRLPRALFAEASWNPRSWTVRRESRGREKAPAESNCQAHSAHQQRIGRRAPEPNSDEVAMGQCTGVSGIQPELIKSIKLKE
ncbi:hypothetical protein FSARC_3723 [Fusarium sarcochroum]|uniref:Uncharacterized protein n=1 Tax=Fusarium sarcochroum TaxID=1208366 RepID=A0A8H4XCB3_9HYPO|nr:hypothetical protein FSARC_3723 [Fusarium sarcochroum]